MTRLSGCLALVLLTISPLSRAQSNDSAVALHLLPAPQEIRIGEGAFPVTASTRVAIASAVAGSHHAIVESLAEEIESQAGFKMGVESSAPASKSTPIILGTLADSRL